MTPEYSLQSASNCITLLFIDSYVHIMQFLCISNAVRLKLEKVIEQRFSNIDVYREKQPLFKILILEIVDM